MGTKTIKIGIFILAIGMLAACKEHSPEKISRSIPSTLQQPTTKLRLGLEALHTYDQKMLLTEMLDQLGLEAYDTLLSSEFRAYAQKWYNKVELAFAQDTLLFHEILFTLGEHNQAKSMLKQVPRPNCNCEMNA